MSTAAAPASDTLFMRGSSLRHRASPARWSWVGIGDGLDAWILPSAGPGCQGARRRMIVLVAALAVAPFLASCAARGAAAATAPSPDEQMGTIRRVGPFGFAIVPDRDPGTRYVPERRFPPAFEVDGLRVLFSGTQGPAPEGTRTWGTPFRLSTLRRAP